MKTTFFDASGTQVDASVACDTNGVIRHGFRMKTNLLMMDAETRDPFVPLTDEQKIADIDARDAKLSDAWRNPTPLKPDAAHLNPPNGRTATVDMDTVYERHDKRLQDAWKQPAL